MISNNLELSEMQAEYIRNAVLRWNFKFGATRCGKTTLDFIHTIPEGLVEAHGKQGLNFIGGVSKQTIERNVLTPMRQFWGKELVGEINRSTSICRIFGEDVVCLGCKTIDAVATLRGCEIKFGYGDEVPEWNQEVFELMKSRLSLPYSQFHGTGNPKDSMHYLYKFCYEDFDPETMFVQNYTIDDNPFLDPLFVKALKKEYERTIYYDRYILGKWVRAEGAIYKILANNPKAYILKDIPTLSFINIGVDFGGNKSKHSFTATGFTPGYRKVIVLECRQLNTDLTPTELEQEYIAFVNMVRTKYNTLIKEARLDSAEQVLIGGIKSACIRAGVVINNKNAIKGEILDRIRLMIRLIGSGRIYWTENSTASLNAFCTAVYDPKAKTDTRLDDGSTDIDDIDSTEYSIEPETRNLLKTLGG